MKIAGIILAAGESRRMGRVKAMLDWRGVTLLDHMIRLLAEVASPVIAVLGFHAEAVRADGAVFVVNPDPARGMLSSLQTGLRAAPAASEAALFTPVDYPAVAPETIGALARAFTGSGAPLAVPVCRERRGHPVLIGRPLMEEILLADPRARADEILRRHLDRAVLVDVEDAGVLEDIDDPETYRRLRGEDARA